MLMQNFGGQTSCIMGMWKWRMKSRRFRTQLAPCFKTAEKEAESEAEMVETGWSVSTLRVLIQFYKGIETTKSMGRKV